MLLLDAVLALLVALKPGGVLLAEVGLRDEKLDEGVHEQVDGPPALGGVLLQTKGLASNYHRAMKSAHSIETSGEPTRVGGALLLMKLWISIGRLVFGKGCSPVAIS